ncbi:MAG TPA: hypothetical protein VG796_11950 [Verrucomicrobiales bacterium]|nr:hypothetical protein [Verrucomicrobiales bacterium]
MNKQDLPVGKLARLYRHIKLFALLCTFRTKIGKRPVSHLRRRSGMIGLEIMETGAYISATVIVSTYGVALTVMYLAIATAKLLSLWYKMKSHRVPGARPAPGFPSLLPPPPAFFTSSPPSWTASSGSLDIRWRPSPA